MNLGRCTELTADHNNPQAFVPLTPPAAASSLSLRSSSSLLLRRPSAVGGGGNGDKEGGSGQSSQGSQRRQRLLEDTMFSLETRAQQLAREVGYLVFFFWGGRGS